MEKTVNFERLEELFPGKILPKFITCTRACPLRYEERLVYSALLFRARTRGSSGRQLARMTQIDRNKTLPKVLERLVDYELAEARGKRWYAVAPSEDHAEWFRTIHYHGNEDTPLDAQYAYCRFVMPVSNAPIRIKDSLIMVADYLSPNLSNGLLAARFRVSKRTVIRSRNKLRSYGTPLLSWFADRPVPAKRAEGFIPLRQPYQDQEDRGTPKAQRESRPRQRCLSTEERLQQIIRDLRLPEVCHAPARTAITKMTAHGIKPENQFGILAAIRRAAGRNEDTLMLIMFGLPDKVDELMREHRNNTFESGKNFGDGSGLFFKWINKMKL